MRRLAIRASKCALNISLDMGYRSSDHSMWIVWRVLLSKGVTTTKEPWNMVESDTMAS